MTLICGGFDPTGESDWRSDLCSMLSVCSSQADYEALWHEGPAALGQGTWYITPESLRERLPLPKNDLIIVGDIRLDNRKELFCLLNLPEKDPPPGDAGLVLAAYEKWGEACPEHLLGDFSFAIWNKRQQELFCCRDHFGIRGLFYFYNGKKFLFSTNAEQIIRVRGVDTGISRNKLATLVIPSAKHLFWEESWFENISLLPAGTTFTVTRNGIKRRKYWTPGIGKELRFKNENEYAEAFLEIMSSAVSDRMRSIYPVTALLSGGLDSSSVVSVAAKILEKQNKELQTFSYVLPDENDPELKDERQFIETFRTFPNLKINYITVPEQGFLTNLEKLQTMNGPHIHSRHFIYDAFVSKALSLGSRTILDGGAGELGATFSGEGAYAEMFRRGHWIRLFLEMSKSRSFGPRSLLVQTLRPNIPGFLLRTADKGCSLEISEGHCLQPELAEALRLQILLRKRDLSAFSTGTKPLHRENQLRYLLGKQRKAQGGHALGILTYNMPMMDKRLLEFCLSLPYDLKVKNGYPRYTARAGLKNLLPPEIRWRNSKTPLCPDYIRRYNAQLPLARKFLESIEPRDPVRSVIDVEKLKAWAGISVAIKEYGTYNEQIARDFLPQGIYLICFLRRFKEYRI
jgi:asparagine synthase (glutamine-hydrolysing)